MTAQQDDPDLRGPARLAAPRVPVVRLNRRVLYVIGGALVVVHDVVRKSDPVVHKGRLAAAPPWAPGAWLGVALLSVKKWTSCKASYLNLADRREPRSPGWLGWDSPLRSCCSPRPAESGNLQLQSGALLQLEGERRTGSECLCC